MIVVDRALAERARAGNPIRVGLVGAGFMGRGIALQILTATPGMELVAIGNRTLASARRAYTDAGVEGPTVVETLAQLEEAVAAGSPAVTEDGILLARAEGIDVIIEVTGAIEFAAQVISTAIEHRKHVVLMNAEVDGTVGPILKARADEAGVVYTNADGDQPGVIMNLYRFVTGIGVKPVLCGNIKGLHDPYRTPATQAEFARKWGQKPHMVASFADGSKVSFEQAIVANATGMRVAQRAMFGPTVEPGTPIERAAELFPPDVLLEEPGIVDYVVGASPNPGVFVLGTHDHPTQQHYLSLYKLGPGPFYCFYTPYHLCHFEIPATVVRAVDFGDAAIAPLGGVCVDVVTTAKRDLEAGETIDGLGGYMTYGVCENADVAAAEDLLPIGLAEGCRLKRDVAKDDLVRSADVDRPPGRLADRLRADQDALFAPAPAGGASVLR
jgi:predicted homoserine dehydrogenase-like protein